MSLSKIKIWFPHRLTIIMGHSQSIPDTTDLNLLCIKYTFSQNQFAFIPTYPRPQVRPKIDQRTWQDCRSAQRWAWMSYKNISKKLGENMTTVRAIIQKKLSPLKEFFPHRVRMITKKVDQPRATLVNDVKANKTTVTKNTTFNTLHIETLQRSKFPPWLCGRSYKLRRRTFPPLYIDYCRQRKRLTILK